jgi:hypothetical protein
MYRCCTQPLCECEGFCGRVENRPATPTETRDLIWPLFKMHLDSIFDHRLMVNSIPRSLMLDTVAPTTLSINKVDGFGR